MEKAKEEFIQKELIKQFSEKVALNIIARFLFHPDRYLGQRCIRDWNTIN